MEQERVSRVPERVTRAEEAIPVRRERDVRDVEQTTQVIIPRDRIRWGTIWAGLLIALASFLLLSLLALTIGALTVDTGQADTGTAATTTGWVTAIIGLIAFFLGGWVAGATSAARGTAAGLLNGFLVWALGFALILAFSAFGLGQLFGAVGSLFAQYRSLGTVRELGGNAAQANAQQIADAIMKSGFVAFLSMLLPALAAAIGGWIGAKGDPIGHLAGTEQASLGHTR